MQINHKKKKKTSTPFFYEVDQPFHFSGGFSSHSTCFRRLVTPFYLLRRMIKPFHLFKWLVKHCHILRRIVKPCHIFRRLVKPFPLFKRLVSHLLWRGQPIPFFSKTSHSLLLEVNDGQSDY